MQLTIDDGIFFVEVRRPPPPRRARAAGVPMMRRLTAFLLALAASVSPLAAEPLVVGVSAPLSGPDAVFGAQIKLGVMQAATDLTAAGGVEGEPIRVTVGDDHGDPKSGVEVAKSFVSRKVQVVVGPLSSAVAVPASAVYAEAGIVDILPAATAPLATERGLSSIFRLAAREDAQAPVVLRWLVRHGTRVAILHDRTGPGKTLADAVRKGLGGTGAREAYYGSIDKGARELGGLVARLKASGAQAVFWGGDPAEAGQLARQLKEAGARMALIGGFAMASDEFASNADGAAEGALVVFPRDPRAHPAAAALLRRLQARGETADGLVAVAYAAVQIAAQAATRAGSPGALAEAMHAGPFKTVLGDLAFDEKGDLATPDLAIYVWRKGASGRMAVDEEAAS